MNWPDDILHPLIPVDACNIIAVIIGFGIMVMAQNNTHNFRKGYKFLPLSVPVVQIVAADFSDALLVRSGFIRMYGNCKKIRSVDIGYGRWNGVGAFGLYCSIALATISGGDEALPMAGVASEDHLEPWCQGKCLHGPAALSTCSSHDLKL